TECGIARRRRIVDERAIVRQSIAIHVAADHRRERQSGLQASLEREIEACFREPRLHDELMACVEIAARPVALERTTECRGIEPALQRPDRTERVSTREIEIAEEA